MATSLTLEIESAKLVPNLSLTSDVHGEVTFSTYIDDEGSRDWVLDSTDLQTLSVFCARALARAEAE